VKKKNQKKEKGKPGQDDRSKERKSLGTTDSTAENKGAGGSEGKGVLTQKKKKLLAWADDRRVPKKTGNPCKRRKSHAEAQHKGWTKGTKEGSSCSQGITREHDWESEGPRTRNDQLLGTHKDLSGDDRGLTFPYRKEGHSNERKSRQQPLI